MSEWLIPEKLCSYHGDAVRVELGPQVVELEVTPENLSNDKTSPGYQFGKRDALGNIIGSDTKMTCVDHKAKIVPMVWKLYRQEPVPALDAAGNPILDDEGNATTITRFIKVGEYAELEEADSAASAMQPASKAFMSDEIYDQGLDYADTNGTRVDVCSQEPTTYTEATSTYTLGNDTVNTGATEAGATDGRRVIVPAITAGSVTGTGTASHWALTNGTAILVATGALSSSQAVTSGNTFTLDAISLTIRDAA